MMWMPVAVTVKMCKLNLFNVKLFKHYTNRNETGKIPNLYRLACQNMVAMETSSEQTFDMLKFNQYCVNTYI